MAESFVQHDAIVAYHIDSATTGLAKTVRERPELQDRLGWEPVREAVLTFGAWKTTSCMPSNSRHNAPPRT
ncbi:MAG: hypothetical protein ACK4MK_01640 [Tepidimonas ignava]